MPITPIAPSSNAPPRPATDRPTAPARAFGAGFSAAALRHAPVAEQRAAVGAQFEAVLVRQLLGKTLTGMLGSGGGASATVYGGLLADAIATQLAAGRGLGLGRMLEQQLTPERNHPGGTPATSHP